MDVEELIETTLNIPVLQIWDPIIPPCSTYYRIAEYSGLAGDGGVILPEQQYHIDIWCKDRAGTETYCSSLWSAIMGLDSCTIPDIGYMYDNNGKVWHGTIEFIFLNDEWEGN